MRRKTYGQSRQENCPFCGKQGTTTNPQGIPVCAEHKHTKLDDIKCSCGSWLEVREGKWGAYFNCINCGNFNFKKGMSLQASTPKPEQTTEEKEKPKPKQREEIHITSDELYLYE
jgi:predicted RNA-binding Zn-ribbon protein involved in translation (DUF1610 family)